MTDHLLTRQEIAALLGTSQGVAASILAEQGVHPIDFGRGRSRGPRWLESAVLAAIKTMHEAAQPHQPKPQIRAAAPRMDMASMTGAQVFALTQQHAIQ